MDEEMLDHLIGGRTRLSVISVFTLSCLSSQGMTEAEEDKLLALKDFMLKSNKAKANMGEQSHLGEAVQTGVIDLATLGITGRQVDLVKPKAEAEDKRGDDAASTHRVRTMTASHLFESIKRISHRFFIS